MNSLWPAIRGLIGHAIGMDDYSARCLVQANMPLNRLDGGLDEADIELLGNLMRSWVEEDLPNPRPADTPLAWCRQIEETVESKTEVVEVIAARLRAKLGEVGFRNVF